MIKSDISKISLLTDISKISVAVAKCHTLYRWNSEAIAQKRWLVGLVKISVAYWQQTNKCIVSLLTENLR